MKRILVIGQHGQVSTYLQSRLANLGELVVAGRKELDLAQKNTIKPALEKIAADLIINPAAYTAVDQAEKEAELAYAINRDAPGEIADWCAASRVPLIHFSTDYVFDGESTKPYREGDLPNPTGIYGASKLAGERAIQHTDANAIILRTSWVYSNHGKNFYKTMLGLAETRDELSVVADQIGSPTYAGSIADGCAKLVGQLLNDEKLAERASGVYHFSCQGETSWHGFAEALFAANKLDKMQVKAISTADYPTPAKRPAYSVLDNSKLEDVFGLALPSWQAGLSECVSDAVT